MGGTVYGDGPFSALEVLDGGKPGEGCMMSAA
jgi:hypothetical protein